MVKLGDLTEEDLLITSMAKEVEGQQMSVFTLITWRIASLWLAVEVDARPSAPVEEVHTAEMLSIYKACRAKTAESTWEVLEEVPRFRKQPPILRTAWRRTAATWAWEGMPALTHSISALAVEGVEDTTEVRVPM